MSVVVASNIRRRMCEEVRYFNCSATIDPLVHFVKPRLCARIPCWHVEPQQSEPLRSACPARLFTCIFLGFRRMLGCLSQTFPCRLRFIRIQDQPFVEIFRHSVSLGLSFKLKPLLWAADMPTMPTQVHVWVRLHGGILRIKISVALKPGVQLLAPGVHLLFWIPSPKGPST